MTSDANMRVVVEALGLPAGARVDARVPKKLLVEQGAPTPADRRAIQDGIAELQWFAACKPATIGVPSFADGTREYLEIAIVGCAFRTEAKAARTVELIHRAIPYPVLLITTDVGGVAISAAHKRRTQNEASKVMVDRIIATGPFDPVRSGENEKAFLSSLALMEQSRRDLLSLYEGWLTRIEALNAARLTGTFSVSSNENLIERRRAAIDEYERLLRENTHLRSQAAKARQISRRVDLNQRIKSIERAMDDARLAMLGGCHEDFNHS